MLVLFLLVATARCLIPGAVFRGDGDGFYQMPASLVSTVFLPSVDAYLTAESSDNMQNPGLRRLILMDAAGNYLSEYSPPTITFLRIHSLSNNFVLFKDPTESSVILPLLEGFQVFKVMNDTQTSKLSVVAGQLVQYGSLMFQK